MHVKMFQVEFYLEGCCSLKEKRSRLSGLRDRYGKQTNLAVCEHGFQDVHSRALWAFVAVGSTIALVDKTLANLEEQMEEMVDALIVHSSFQEL